MSLLIAFNLFHFENIFNYFYKEKLTNAYVTQIEQKWIVNSGTWNLIIWENNCFDLNFYSTYNVDQTIQGTDKIFFLINTSSVKINI